MIKPKTEEEIALLRENALIVSKTLGEVGKAVEPGVTTAALCKIADTCIRDHGAIPSFLGFEGFPAAICASVNDVVVHGFPSDYVLREGDIFTARSTRGITAIPRTLSRSGRWTRKRRNSWR